RTEVADPLRSLLHARLVEVVAENVHAVGTGQVVKVVAVQIGNHHATRRLEEGPGAQMLAHKSAVLEGDAVGVSELEIRDIFTHLCSKPSCLSKACRIVPGQSHERVPAATGDFLGSSIGAEKIFFTKGIVGQQRSNAAGHSGMTGE